MKEASATLIASVFHKYPTSCISLILTGVGGYLAYSCHWGVLMLVLVVGLIITISAYEEESIREKTKRALKHYVKALALLPDDKNAAELLKKLTIKLALFEGGNMEWLLPRGRQGGETYEQSDRAHRNLPEHCEDNLREARRLLYSQVGIELTDKA